MGKPKSKKNTCTICFDTQNEFEKIDDVRKEMFDILSLKIDMDKDPVVCLDCMKVAQKAFDFISVCYDTEELIMSYSAMKQSDRFELKDIFQENAVTEDISEEFNVCRYCLTIMEGDNFIAMDVVITQDMVKEMGLYMKGMDFSIISNPVICMSCKDSLESYLKFVRNAKEKMIKFTNSTIKPAIDEPLDLEYSELSDKPLKGKMLHNETESPNASDEEVPEDLVEIEMSDSEQEDWCGDENNVVKKSGKYHCKLCSYKSTRKYHVTRHLKQHHVKKKPPKCLKCGFQAPSLEALLAHREEHKMETFDCTMCSYKSRYKHNLKSHMVTHTDVSETFDCPKCPYKAKLRGSLRIHMLVHKDRSEIEMFRCKLCPFETKTKSSLKRHGLVHKDISEVKMYKCSKCSYESKLKSNVKDHDKLHHSSEVQTFGCDKCSFETKYKSSLNVHRLQHIKGALSRKHPCPKCIYVATRKGYLRKHMRIIHGPVVVQQQTFGCDSCSYTTTYKGHLKRHMLVHQDVEKLKCASCEYETKDKQRLICHQKVHLDKSQREVFICATCDYKTWYKRDLRDHVTVHMKGASKKVFKCFNCPFATRSKSHLSIHLMKHS